jgi:hypothetical protein
MSCGGASANWIQIHLPTGVEILVLFGRDDGMHHSVPSNEAETGLGAI